MRRPVHALLIPSIGRLAVAAVAALLLSGCGGAEKVEQGNVSGPGEGRVERQEKKTRAGETSGQKGLKVQKVSKEKPDTGREGELKTEEVGKEIQKEEKREPLERKVELPPEFKEAVALAETDPKAAREKFEAIARSNPRLYQARVNLALLVEREGNLKEAERLLKAAHEIEPRDADVLYNLLRVLKKQGRVGEAVRIVEQALAAAPEDKGLKNVLAAALIQSGDLSRAEELTKAVLKEDERNVNAMLNLGDIYSRQGKHELSSFIYEKAGELDPADADLWYRIARENMKLFEATKSKAAKAKALKALKKAVAVDPGHAVAQNNLGVMLLESGDFEGAAKALEAAVRHMPKSYEFRLNYGDALRALHNYKDAEKQYLAALKLKPNGAEAMFNLGLLYLDNEVPGHEDLVKRLDLALKYLNEYKQAMGSRLASDDPCTGYIEDAEKLKHREIKRRERAEKRRLRRLKRKKEEERRRKEEEERRRKEEAKKKEAEKKAEKAEKEKAKQERTKRDELKKAGKEVEKQEAEKTPEEEKLNEDGEK